MFICLYMHLYVYRWGKYTLELIRNIVNLYSPFVRGYSLDFINCFAPPTREYVFPRDLYPYE